MRSLAHHSRLGLAVALMALAACQPAADTPPPPPTLTPVASASLGDLAWLDANANGLQDTGEPGLADVTVRLYEASGQMLAETHSDAGGRYAFTDLLPGRYILEFVAVGYALTQPDQGNDDARDSDPSPLNGRTAIIALNAGQTVTDWDAGFVAAVAVLPTATPSPTSTPAPTITPTPAPPPLEPIEVVFAGKAGDLPGRYYRAASEPAPLVVLMHWIRGDMNDWNEVAVWLQNRGQKNPYPNPGKEPWWDPTWFPPVPEERSYAVLVFSFSGCQPGGCPLTLTPEIWQADGIAAMEFAATLPGVDPERIVAIGSSIGSNAAIISCGQVAHCSGALTLSPGASPARVQEVFNRHPQADVWCLADRSEITGCDMPELANQPAYRAILIPRGGHGTELLQPRLDPLPMQLILDFLAVALGE